VGIAGRLVTIVGIIYDLGLCQEAVSDDIIIMTQGWGQQQQRGEV
jgi:hypothetical protein